MSQEPFITRVVVHNYRSIAACDVRLGPLMFLVGPNGAGKSNFFDAIRFVSDALNFSLGYALQNRFNAEHILYRSGGRRTDHFGIRLDFQLPPHTTGHFAFQVGLNAEDFWEVRKEECVLQVEGKRVYFVRGPRGYLRTSEPGPMPPDTGDRLYLVAAAGLPHFQPVYDALCRMRFYNPDPASLCNFYRKETSDFVDYRGLNLNAVVKRLETHDKEVLDRVVEYLRMVLPGLQRIESAEVGPGRMLRFWLQAQEGQEPEPFWASQMSDGTLRAFAILVALAQTRALDGKWPSLVGIEDVEAAIHPAALAVMYDAMVAASYSTQVLATTQSSDLLDDKHVASESILAVTMEAGQTRIGPISEANRSVLRRRLYTVGELLRIGQLAPEPLGYLGDRSLDAVAPEGQP